MRNKKTNSSLKKIILTSSALAIVTSGAQYAQAERIVEKANYNLSDGSGLDGETGGLKGFFSRKIPFSTGDKLKYNRNSSGFTGGSNVAIGELDFGAFTSRMTVGVNSTVTAYRTDRVTISKISGTGKFSLIVPEGSVLTLDGGDNYQATTVDISGYEGGKIFPISAGSLILNDGVQYHGTIGISSALNEVKINGSVVLLGTSSEAASFILSDNASLKLENGHNLTGDIKNTAGANNTTLILNGATVKGNIGADGEALKDVTFNSDSTLDGNKSFADEFVIADGKTLTLKGRHESTGNIKGGKAKLVLDNATVKGNIGTSGAALKDVTFNSDSTLDGNKSFAEEFVIADGKTLTLKGAHELTGNIKGGRQAKLVLDDATVKGNIGADGESLEKVNFNADSTLDGNKSFAEEFVIADGKTLTLKGRHESTGNIKGGKAKLVLDNATVKGNIGTSGDHFSEVKIVENSVLKSGQAIYADRLVIENDKMLQYKFADDVNIDVVRGGVEFVNKKSKLQFSAEDTGKTISLNSDLFVNIDNLKGRISLDSSKYDFTINGTRSIGSADHRLARLDIDGDKKIKVDVDAFAQSLKLAANANVQFKNLQQRDEGKITLKGDANTAGNITSSGTYFVVNKNKLTHKNGTLILDGDVSMDFNISSNGDKGSIVIDTEGVLDLSAVTKLTLNITGDDNFSAIENKDYKLISKEGNGNITFDADSPRELRQNFAGAAPIGVGSLELTADGLVYKIAPAAPPAPVAEPVAKPDNQHTPTESPDNQHTPTESADTPDTPTELPDNQHTPTELPDTPHTATELPDSPEVPSSGDEQGQDTPQPVTAPVSDSKDLSSVAADEIVSIVAQVSKNNKDMQVSVDKESNVATITLATDRETFGQKLHETVSKAASSEEARGLIDIIMGDMSGFMTNGQAQGEDAQSNATFAVSAKDLENNASVQMWIALSNAKDDPDLVERIINSSSTEQMSISSEATSVVNANITASANNIIAQRMDNLVSVSNFAQVAASAGDEQEERRHGIWVSGMMSQGTQKKAGKNSGYGIKSSGATLGFDTMLENNLTLGAAVSMAESKVDFKDSKYGDATKIGSKIFSVYGVVPISYAAFMQGVVSYADNAVNSSVKRIISKESYSKARSKYRSKGYNAELLLGYNIYVNENSLTLTPIAGARYSVYEDDAYTEKGNLSRNMSIAKKSGYKMEGVFGARLALAPVELENSAIISTGIHGFINQEISSKAGKVKAKLVGSSRNVPTPKKASTHAKTNFNLGGSVNMNASGSVDISLGYDANLMKGFMSHQGSLKIRVGF